ncbi:glucosamine-6-phosphate deaminase [Virgibacillus ainsalahensis]
MDIIKVKNYEAMSEQACAIILKEIAALNNPVLGLATGSTPEGMYKHLVEANKKNEGSFEDVSTFNLDEYVGLDPDDKNSYNHYMYEKLFNHIDIKSENVHLPKGNAADLQQTCQDYEALIQDAGGIDLQVLGIGINGHIGFNEPGTPFDSRTHVVDLEESTRQANARFFRSLDDVPKQAITMGIDTIMESKKIILLVSGESKREALNKLMNREVTEDVPASVLQNHKNVVVVADEAAIGE